MARRDDVYAAGTGRRKGPSPARASSTRGASHVGSPDEAVCRGYCLSAASPPEGVPRAEGRPN
jgi:hypothetical protein